MADAKLTALTAASALAAADLFYVSQSAASRKATGAQLLALVGTAYVPLAGGTMTGALTLPAGAVGTPSLMFTGAGATTGIFSHAASTMSFAANGTVSAFISNEGFQFRSSLYLGWVSGGGANASSPDLIMQRDSAGALALRFLTQQHTLRIYNTYTDASNYERLTLTGVAGTSVNLTAETLGTGGDNLDIVLTPAGTGGVNLGSLVKVPNNGAIRNSDSGGTHRLYLDVSNVVFRRGDGASAAGMWKFGGETSSFVGMKGSGTTMLIRLGDDSADAPLSALYVKTASTTVAALTAAATAGAGARAFVTDANATTFLSTVAAGGANKVPVVSDGTNWLIG